MAPEARSQGPPCGSERYVGTKATLLTVKMGNANPHLDSFLGRSASWDAHLPRAPITTDCLGRSPS